MLIFVAMAGFCVAAVLNLLSWLPIDASRLTPIWVADLVLIFIVWLPAILSLNAILRSYAPVTRRRWGFSASWGSSGLWNVPWRQLLEPIPVWLWTLGVLLVAYVFIAFFAGFAQLPYGPPEIDGGKYFFDNHGFLTPTDLAGYLQGMRVTMRMFTGHTMLFLGLGTLFLKARGRLRTLAPPGSA